MSFLNNLFRPGANSNEKSNQVRQSKNENQSSKERSSKEDLNQQQQPLTWEDKFAFTNTEILEDSPLAHEKLRKLEQQSDKSVAKLKKVLALSKQYQSAGNTFKEAGNQLGVELLSWEYGDLPNNEAAVQVLTKNIKALGQNIMELNDYWGMLLLQMANVFTQPIDMFLSESIKTLHRARQQLQTAKSLFASSLAKNSSLKKSEVSPKLSTEVESELQSNRLRYQSASLDYLFRLKEFQFSSKVEYVERSCAFLYAEKAYFTQANSLHVEVEKSLSDISKHMSLSRKVIEEERTNKSRVQNVDLVLQKNKNANEMEKVGYLFIKHGNKWERRYFGVRSGHLVRYITNREEDRMEISIMINLLICTVRPARDVDRRFCFEIVSPQETFVFQAENDAEAQEWIQVIQQGIVNQLNKQVSPINKNSSGQIRRSNTGPLLQFRENESNNLCADCGAADPEWASINLGIMICIDCSGIHRQLGTHISRVRSTTLDLWDKDMLKLFMLLGNEISKNIFEFHAPPLPDLSSDRNMRENWIRAKYVEKKFLRPLPPSHLSPEILLHKAVEEEDLLSVYHCIMANANIQFKNPESGVTALHIAVRFGFSSIAELLIQNGADCNAQDSTLWTPLHYCAKENKIECAVLLIKRGAKTDMKDINDLNPLEVAMSNYQAHCVTLLRLAMHAESEYAKNARNDDSFTHALKNYSEEMEKLLNDTES